MSDSPRRVRALSYCEANGLPRPTGDPSSNGAAAKVKASKPSKAARPSKAIGQRFQTINNFVDVIMRDLPRTPLAVWILLWRDSRDGIARVSQSDMANRVGCSDRQIRNAIRRLESDGLIRVLKRGNSFQSCSAYEVLSDPS